jgi:hypothetical protein
VHLDFKKSFFDGTQILNDCQKRSIRVKNKMLTEAEKIVAKTKWTAGEK